MGLGRGVDDWDGNGFIGSRATTRVAPTSRAWGKLPLGHPVHPHPGPLPPSGRRDYWWRARGITVMCSLVAWLVGAGLKPAPTGVEVFTVRVAPPARPLRHRVVQRG